MYVGTVSVPATLAGNPGMFAGATVLTGYVGEGGTVLTFDGSEDGAARRAAVRFATRDEAVAAATAAAGRGMIPGVTRLRGRELRP